MPNKWIFLRGFVTSFAKGLGVGIGMDDWGFFLAFGVLGVTVELVFEDSGREGILWGGFEPGVSVPRGCLWGVSARRGGERSGFDFERDRERVRKV
jgi:hypothetical protein